MNYILNQDDPASPGTPIDWTSATQMQRADLTVSLMRGTFRPLPIAASQLTPFNAANPTQAINERFTGGTSEYACERLFGFAQAFRIRKCGYDQLARSLIAPQDGWDVDNDSDGIVDSIWIDMGLPPVFTSPDGKFDPTVDRSNDRRFKWPSERQCARQ